MYTNAYIPRDNDISNFNSVIQTHPKDTLSGKYNFIPTTHIIDLLKKYDWTVSDVSEARVLNDANQGFQKHIVRFRNSNHQLKEIGDTIPELVLFNSHDGCSSFKIMAGMFRLACKNGLVVADSTFETHKIRHAGYRDQDVIDAVFHVVDTVPRITEKVKLFSEIELSKKEQAVFAESAALVKWDKEALPDTDDLLGIRRGADMGNDLYTIYNRVQEHIMRGGVRAVSAKNDKYGRKKTYRSRAVKSVQENIKVNQALWTLTEKMAQIKLESILPY